MESEFVLRGIADEEEVRLRHQSCPGDMEKKLLQIDWSMIVLLILFY